MGSSLPDMGFWSCDFIYLLKWKFMPKKAIKWSTKITPRVVMCQQNWAGFWQAKLQRKFLKCLDPRSALQVQESLGLSMHLLRSWNFSSCFYYDHALHMHLPCRILVTNQSLWCPTDECLCSNAVFTADPNLSAPCCAVHVSCYCPKQGFLAAWP